MCGIVGMVAREGGPWRAKTLKKCASTLLRLSESRGKEAAGIALLQGDHIHVHKDDQAASSMVKSAPFRHLMENIVEGEAAAFIGHSRLVTHGAACVYDNNQPVIVEGAVGVHNGIIVNHEHLWQAHTDMHRRYQVDSEVVFSLLRRFVHHNHTLASALRETFVRLEGMASIAAFLTEAPVLFLATNNGSLYQCMDQKQGIFLFASERFILEQLLKTANLSGIDPHQIVRIHPGSGCLVHLSKLWVKTFSLVEAPTAPYTSDPEPASTNHRTVHLSGKRPTQHPAPPPHQTPTNPLPPLATLVASFSKDVEHREKIRRCVRCILPETMPYIRFDAAGVCLFCNHHQKLTFYGRERLEHTLTPHRRRRDAPDCLVGLSGGRDSTYTLHYVKTVLGMNPVAYTYDWGMITDLARRNISRICGKLGVEHILVSADIHKKRDYIRRNVMAWLKRPCLGTIPLFMAGDKAYFYHAQRLKKQLGVNLVVLGENMLERTHFKTGFAHIPPDMSDQNHVYTLSPLHKMRLVGFFVRAFLLNPAYLNRSMADSMMAFVHYYMTDRAYVNLFNYIPWDEQEILHVLRTTYDWETADDTSSTWRIGDGTAAFYNYIFMTVAGFSENDTFRSNQIREGIIDRETGLRQAALDNQPRLKTFQWYLDTIGLEKEIQEVLSIIHRIPKLYPSL